MRQIEIRSTLFLSRPIASCRKPLWIDIRSPKAVNDLRPLHLDFVLRPFAKQLLFEDIRPLPADLSPFRLFNESMADQVIRFVDRDWDRLIVSCEAGVSRSSAIALAISEHYGLPSPIDKRFHDPNPLVLEIMRQRLSHQTCRQP